MTEPRIVKWGIMGPGGISDNFATELPHAPGGELVAVAGRSLDKAQAFADKFGIPRAYGSCEELAADPDVEIVYIGTLHPIHKDNALTLLRGGKSVLCEKPFTINAAEAREIAELAREKGLFLMEAMWTRFLPAIVKVREWLDSGVIGDVRIVKAEFGFDAGWHPEGRLLNKEKGGGTLLDAGIYPVSFASLAYGGEQPTRIVSSAAIGETGVDEQFSALFEYSGGRTATVHGSVRLALTNEAVIYGTKGRIEVENFLFGKSATLHVRGEEPVVFKQELAVSGHYLQAIEAMECLRAGRKESPAMTVDETVRIMETLDAIRAPWGLKYPSEA